MKTSLTMLLSVVFFSFFYSTAQAKELKDDPSEQWRYDIECAGTGTEGTYLVKVWTYAKNAKVPAENMKKNAVHGVIFRGFSGTQGCTSQKPLAKSPAVQQEKADYFNTFFGTGGTYLKYANVVSATPEVIKLNKKEYKVGVIVSVSKDVLRKDLEAAGVVKSLTSGF